VTVSHGTVTGVDHAWAANVLQDFVIKLRSVQAASKALDTVGRVDGRIEADMNRTIEDLISLEPVMRDLMNAARPGFGDYASGSYSDMAEGYWIFDVLPWALRAIGVHTIGAEARERMRPDSPDLAADQFHPWVWEAAAPMWEAGSTQEAVNAAARSVNARLRQKLNRHDVSEVALCREAFNLKDPEGGRPRLRFPGDRNTDTWKSRQEGAMNLGAGCYMGIRNPAVHEDGLDLPEQVALEQLAAFSVLARWIDECTVEAVS